MYGSRLSILLTRYDIRLLAIFLQIINGRQQIVLLEVEYSKQYQRVGVQKGYIEAVGPLFGVESYVATWNEDGHY